MTRQLLRRGWFIASVKHSPRVAREKTMPDSQGPIHEIKLGRIRATIWGNRTNRQTLWYSVTVSRKYRDGEQWKETTSFGRDDLPLLSKAVELAYGWIWKQTSQSNSESEE